MGPQEKKPSSKKRTMQKVKPAQGKRGASKKNDSGKKTRGASKKKMTQKNDQDKKKSDKKPKKTQKDTKMWINTFFRKNFISKNREFLIFHLTSVPLLKSVLIIAF